MLSCAVLSGNLALAQSQYPPTTAGQQNAAEQERGSENFPLIVKVVPEEKSKDELAREYAREQSEGRLVELTGDLALYTWRLFLATAGLVFATSGLVVVGFRQIRDAKEAIAAAVKSANVAERALTELERPFVYGGVSEPGLRVVPSSHKRGSELGRGVLELSIYNFGRTPAILTRIEYAICPAPHGDICPAMAPSVVGGRELPVGTVCVSGDPFVEGQNLRWEFFDEEDDVIASKQSVWITGFVRYDDIFGAHYITGFTQVFDTVSNRFVRRGGQHYNYTRKEETAEIPPASSQG